MQIESDAESDPGLLIDEPAKETPKESALTEQAAQPMSADTSGTPLATGVQTALDVQGEE